MAERAKPILWERKRCKFSLSIHDEKQEQTEGSYLEKRIKSTAKLVSQEGKKNITHVERTWGRGVKRYFREWWK